MKLLTYFLIILCFFSCSQKKKEKKKVKVQAQIRMAALAGYGGGGILIGTNGPESFTYFLDQNNITIELPNGLWDFIVFGWSGGNGTFSGSMLCDVKKTISLEGEEADLSFELAYTKCGVGELGPGFSRDGSGQPYPLTFNSCANWLQMVQKEGATNIDPFITQTIPYCDDAEGKEVSFRLRMYQTKLTADPWATRIDPVESTCQGSRTLGAGPQFTSNLRWPIMQAGFARIPLEIIAYDGAGCTGSAKVYQFKQGSGEFSEGNEALFMAASAKIGVTLHSNLCEGTFLTNTPFANYTSTTFANDTEYLICSEVQLQELAEKWVDWNGPSSGLHAKSGISFRLGKSINLTGTFTTPIGNATYPFSAEFNGSGYTLSNWSYAGAEADAGLFGVIGDAEIADLLIDNFQFAPSGTAQNVGVLFGSLADQTSTRTEIERISIHNTNNLVTINCNDCEDVGGLGGSVDITADQRDVEVRSIHIENIHVDGGEVGAASRDVGGVFGRFLSNTSTRLRATNIYFQGKVEGHSHVAGFSSLMGNSEVEECEIHSNATDYIKGHEYVAGIVAEAFDNTQVSKCLVNAIVQADGADTITGNPDTSRKFFGGALGKAEGGTFSDLLIDVQIESVLNDDTHYVGGVAGDLKTAACGPMVNFYNVKVASGIAINGEFVGGGFGQYKCGETKNILVESSITTKSAVDADNEYRGLFAGQILDSSSMVNYAILEGDVTGSGHVGGITGYNQGWISNIYLEDNSTVTCNRSNLFGIAGGVVGKTATSSNIANVMSHADVYYTQTGAFSNGGKYAGFSGIDSITANDNIILLGEIDDGGSEGDEGIICGTVNTNCSISSAEFFEGPEPIANPPFNSDPSWVDDGSGNATLTFLKSWSQFNYDSSAGDNSPSGDRLAGNYLEPFHLYDCSDWNKIANNEILVSKSYILMNHIDFDACGGTFIPIGGGEAEATPHKFTGNIISNKKEIRNINFTFTQAINSGWGLVRYLGDENLPLRPRIGDRREPLVVDNVIFNGSSHVIDASFGIVAGRVESGDVSTHVVNSQLVAGGACGGCFKGIGGVVGFMLEGSLDGSSFRSSEIDASNGSYDNVGGLIGLIESSSSMRQSRVYIYESMSDAAINANNSVGGLIGSIETSMNNSYVGIRESYYFNASPDALQSNETLIGTLIGYLYQIDNNWNINLDLENSYGYANLTAGSAKAIGDAFNSDGAPNDIGIKLETDIFYSNSSGTIAQSYTHGNDTVGTGTMNDYSDLATLYSAISNETTGLDQERFSLDPANQRARLWFEVDGYYHDDHH